MSTLYGMSFIHKKANVISFNLPKVNSRKRVEKQRKYCYNRVTALKLIKNSITFHERNYYYASFRKSNGSRILAGGQRKGQL